MLVQSTSATGTDSVMCSLCNQSYVLTDTGCAPCLEGCQVCSANQLTSCIQCSPGWMMNTDNICVKSSDCPMGCTSCTTFGCLDCADGMFLNHDFMCQYYCMTPCASCSASSSASLCNWSSATHCDTRPMRSASSPVTGFPDRR